MSELTYKPQPEVDMETTVDEHADELLAEQFAASSLNISAEKILCIKCGIPAGFQSLVEEPYTCLTCQPRERPSSKTNVKTRNTTRPKGQPIAARTGGESPSSVQRVIGGIKHSAANERPAMSVQKERCPVCGSREPCSHNFDKTGEQLEAIGRIMGVSAGPRVLAAPPCSVVRTHRSVIEHKLLTALEDDNTVAALFSKRDLEDTIAALYGYEIGERNGDVLSWEAHMERRREIADSMSQLLREAFPLKSQALDKKRPD